MEIGRGSMLFPQGGDTTVELANHPEQRQTTGWREGRCEAATLGAPTRTRLSEHADIEARAIARGEIGAASDVEDISCFVRVSAEEA